MVQSGRTMAFISDNAFDSELQKMKGFLETIKRNQTIFANNFHTLPAKERARTLTQIQTDHKVIVAFLEKAKKVEIANSRTKFGLENIKNTFQTLLGQWRKIEKTLETFVTGSAPKEVRRQDPETRQAVEGYIAALKNMGQNPNNDMINEFKVRLQDAYTKAKEKSGGKDLAIHVVQDGSKIKVRMEPK